MFRNFKRNFSKHSTPSVQGDLIGNMMTDLYKTHIVNLRRYSQTHELITISNELYQDSSSVSVTRMTLEDYGKWTMENLMVHSGSDCVLQIGVQTLRELRMRDMFAHLKKKTLDWAEAYRGDGWDEILCYAALTCAESDKDMLEKLCATFILRMNAEMADPELVNVMDHISHWDVLRFLAEVSSCI